MNRLREENITFGSRDQETSLTARIKLGLCIQIMTIEKTDSGCTRSSGVYAKSLHRKKEWLLIQQMEIMKMQDIGSMVLLLSHYFRVSCQISQM